MSCHNIGHAMNYVQERIMELYEEGKYDLATAKELLIRCNAAMGYCDGNHSEATDYLDRHYCSGYFKKLPPDELYYYWLDDLDSKFVYKYI